MPIALLRHVLKVIEAAIEMIVRKLYSFRDCQLGFGHATGTETTIIRHVSKVNFMGTTAVSDMKFAYDCVPRKRYKRCLRRS